MRKLLSVLPVTIRVVAASVIVVSLIIGCSHAKQTSKEVRATAGGLTVSFTTSPWPPHSGDDTAIVGIVDTATGLPVDNASIVATADMTAPKAPGSPASGRYQGGGRYDVPLRLVATTYNIDVHIERPGKPAVDVAFPVEAWQ